MCLLQFSPQLQLIHGSVGQSTKYAAAMYVHLLNSDTLVLLFVLWPVLCVTFACTFNWLCPGKQLLGIPVLKIQIVTAGPCLQLA